MNDRELRRQLTELRDIEAIKQLMAEYCDIADDDHNQDRIASIFTEDGIWEGGDDGRAQGHAEIRALFKRFAEQISFSQHNVYNFRIRVDGDRAEGTSYFFGPFTFRENGFRCWIIGRSEDDYAKEGGVWKIRHHRGYGITVPYEMGWPAQTPPDAFANQAWRGRPRSAGDL
ncbi:MAG: nuclear transport factor 2 family protein [Rhodospirillaceae bacterium]|nr:nuclear transport factor 2 family protein [Rhodospirillaceae bacterium]